MMSNFLQFFILTSMIHKTFGTVSVYANKTTQANGDGLLLTCSITAFSLPASWINNATGGILSVCLPGGLCSVTTFGRYSFSATASTIVAQISSLTVSTDDFGWKCQHDTDVHVFIFTLENNTVSESVSRTSSLHDSTDSPDQRQIRDVRRRRGIRRRESIRRGTGRGSSRRGTVRESGSRGRGRVTRQRRGRGNQGPSKVALTAEARDYQLKERIANMTKEDKDSLLARICQKHPNMVFELINGSSMEQQGYHLRPGGESPSWCICNNCREMPTDEEKQCCKQIMPNCYSRLPDFDLVVLDEVVLLVAQRYRQDVLAAEENDYNRGKRHAAYRQFILWTYGYLGAGNRRVIPSCCVWRIRDKYPDSFGQYRGFTHGRLG